MDIDQERLRFEMWYSIANPTLINALTRKANGQYVHEQIEAGWNGWCARAKLAQQDAK
jgi:hypothetical protein